MPEVDYGLETTRSETEKLIFNTKPRDQNVIASVHKAQDTFSPQFGKKRKANSFDEDSGSLCDRCNSITGEIAGLHSLTSVEGFQHLSLLALKQSSAAGCGSCLFLLNNVRKVPKKWDDDDVIYLRDQSYLHSYAGDSRFMGETKFYAGLHFLHERFGTLDVFVDSSSRQNRSQITSLFLFATDRPASKFIKTRLMRTDVSTDGSFRHARLWIEVCQSDHSKCPGSKLPVLPTRLIKIGDDKLGEGVQLYRSRTNEKGHYAALSYCWGGSQLFTLTTSSLGSCLKGIIATELPQTIQDAIKTTQKLGLKYLWVDALCIIQDCPNDKAREISHMGGIYKNATATIAAANASAASEGFLGPRPRIPSCELPFFRPPPEEYESQKIRDMRGPGKVWLSALSTSDDGEEPLYQRAWTLQERLLSPRMLLFGGRELTWQCQQESTQSIGQTFYRRKTGSKRLPVNVFIYKKSGKKDKKVKLQVDLWKSIIEDYSRRNITFRQDRMSALAGVAKELETVWKDTYIAGLWEKCLISHLGWHRSGKMKSNSKPPLDLEEYLGPTWSWVSFDGPVLFDVIKVEEDDNAKLVGYKVTPITADAPLGRLQYGHIELNAAIAEVTHPSSKQVLTSWDVSMDKIDTINTDTVLYIQLGFTNSHRAVGLMLMAV